ncbi:hypothetical protein NLG97_g2960 [Lecanicillium saksenae]|uniref:Uncharacterized protein n=1 Tax=Lecanicillium saksenae TaxID=468837 RepID=A0ACC1R0U9_9HYPO|nr:hypothetical protein NLG97_g2960 [Lecanicillium saksenae]
MDTAPVLSPIESIILDLPPSCLQFCRRYHSYFVIGTYNLHPEKGEAIESADVDSCREKKSQSRNGSLLVYHIGNENSPRLSLVQTVSQPSALLDIRFNNEYQPNADILAAVSSTGTLAIFRLNGNDKSAPLQHLATSRCDDLDEDVLFLQCKWHPYLPNVVAVTTSTGSARLLYLDPQWKISQYANVNIPNSLEAWSIAISPVAHSESNASEATVYCGGDDSILRYTSCSWATGDPFALPEEQYSPMQVKGQHGAGVTAILPLDLNVVGGGRVVITGSYDDHIRVFIIHDLHKSYGARRVEQVLEENLEGGVWRLDLISLAKDDAGTCIAILASLATSITRATAIPFNVQLPRKYHGFLGDHPNIYIRSFLSLVHAAKNLRIVAFSFTFASSSMLLR